MLLPIIIIASSLAISTAIPVSPLPRSNNNSKRDAAFRDTPNYAPYAVSCPTDLKVHQSTTAGPLNPAEANYINSKAETSSSLWSTYLENALDSSFDINQFLPAEGVPKIAGKTLPNVAIAISGGGFRSMIVGGAILQAFDSRNQTSNDYRTGGILQLANYAVGLSGGAWCIGSWAAANFPTFNEMLSGVWDFGEDAFLPRQNLPTVYEDIAVNTALKRASGYPVSSVDPYGRLLSYHFFNDTDNLQGPGSQTLFSGISRLSSFTSFEAPFPIIYSTGRQIDRVNVTLSDPNYESTPVSFGLNHPSVGQLAIDLEYLGSNMMAGTPAGLNSCVRGHDNAGWLLGASGNSITDPVFLLQLSYNFTEAQREAQNSIFNNVPDAPFDSAVVQNPFFGISPDSDYVNTADETLYLVDGGAGGTGQEITNLPLWPLLQPARQVDVIFAIDTSQDTSLGYPNGAALVVEYEKVNQPGFEAYQHTFPKVPTTDEFIASGRNNRTSFFGSSCQSDYLTNGAIPSPLIVWIPNRDISYATNSSTSSSYYSEADQAGNYANGFSIATESPACYACAIIDAQMTRNGVARTAQCADCFADFCYNA